MLEINTRKHIHKLHQKKYRQEFNEFLVEGEKGVEEALKADGHVVAVVVESNKQEDLEYIIDLAKREDVPVFFCNEKDIAQIKTTDTFPGVMAIVEMPDYSIDDFDPTKPIIALDSVNDPGNLGTIIRSADWFGTPNILLLGQSVDPYNPKVVRSTMGSLFRTRVVKASYNVFKKINRAVYAFDLEGKDVKTLDSGEMDAVLLFGSESHGISAELEHFIDSSYTIAKTGGAESLNLGVSVSIVLYQLL